MKQADIAQQLGNMIDQQNMHSGNLSIDENIPSELEEPAPVFDIDYDKEKLDFTTNAFETIKIIVKSVVPGNYQEDELLKNKMKLDAAQLGMLYYQQKLADVALRCAMDTLAAGCQDPKMHNSVEKYFKRLSDISDQITETQNQFRKYYIDTYLDIESKNRVDEVETENPKMIENKKQKQLESVVSDNGVVTDTGSIRFSGNKIAIKEMAALKKERLKKAAEAEIVESSEN